MPAQALAEKCRDGDTTFSVLAQPRIVVSPIRQFARPVAFDCYAGARPSEFPASGRLEYQYDFGDFDAVDDAKAPAADQVLTLDEYKASPRVGPGDPLAPPEG